MRHTATKSNVTRMRRPRRPAARMRRSVDRSRSAHQARASASVAPAVARLVAPAVVPPAGPPVQVLLPPQRGRERARLEGVAVLACTLIALGLLWYSGHVTAPWAWRVWGWNRATLILGLLFAAPFAWRMALWLSYRAKPPLPTIDPRLPEVTVVIPAYNEGETVFQSIRSILASDYPAQKLRIIVVDDGSKDDTLAHARRAALLDPDRVSVIAKGENGGKRRALHAGFTRVTTEVVVTVDSDTVLPSDSLRALVTPLVLNEKVQCVAGRIDVLNRDDNLLTRMLAVRYRLGFDFIRAAQSQLGSVLVSPGAFSAYRMDAIRHTLTEWVNQRFLGAPCSNGDDHHLTNMVLRQGGLAVYQGNAPARTRVPRRFKQLALMYLRWSRSNIRESWLWLGFVPRLLRRPDRWPAVVDGVAHFIMIPPRIVLSPLAVVAFVLSPGLVLSAIFSTIVASSLYAIMYLRSERSFEAALTGLYAVFTLLTMWWLYPVALLTVRQSRWLTR